MDTSEESWPLPASYEPSLWKIGVLEYKVRYTDERHVSNVLTGFGLPSVCL